MSIRKPPSSSDHCSAWSFPAAVLLQPLLAGFYICREGLQPSVRAIVPVAAVSWLFTHLAAAPFLLLFLGISISQRKKKIKSFNSIY